MSADLKKTYPDQFDKIGNFSGTATLILKEHPFIDPRISTHENVVFALKINYRLNRT